MKFNLKGLPEHGISLIAPSDPTFIESETVSIDPYSILLKNAGTRAVVGYSIKWECFDGKGDFPGRNVSNDRIVSNIISWVFLHGDESARRAAVNASDEIIKPNSIWIISFNSPAHPLMGGLNEMAFGTKDPDESGAAKSLGGCAKMTVITDGVFFDDGTFIGPDTKGLFTEVKSQMDARYEILREVQDELKSGKNSSDIFRRLERIRDFEGLKLEEQPTAAEFRLYFRNMFARDVLGKKEVWGADKALEDVQLQLSKPWVDLRKL